MATVTLRNVGKVYSSDITAVKSASLEIKDKEFMVLVGPSGCGKSTLLRMVAGLEEISSGEIFIDGRLINNVPPKERDIAMVFQNYALYPHMSVYKNMAFALKLRKYPKDKIDARVREAAEILGITSLLERKPKELSGGQRQRVAVGRAIVRKPKVFLFDEPLSNLDAKMRVQMRTEIIKLHNKLQATMIYVTHDQVEAMTMGSRITVLRNGLIQQVADPMTIYQAPINKFVASFIGSPPMNFMHGRLLKTDKGLCFDEGGFQVRVPESKWKFLKSYIGKEIVFGIRPEDIYDKLFVGITPLAEHTIRATVDLIEPMGSDIYLHLNTGKNTFQARMDPKERTELNQDIDIVFDMQKVHFFDPETELNIGLPS